MSHPLPDEIDGIPTQRGYGSGYTRWFIEVIDDHLDECLCGYNDTNTASVIRLSRPATEEELRDWTKGHWVPGFEGRQ